MKNRRDFIKSAALGTIGVTTFLNCKDAAENKQDKPEETIINTQSKPIVISTWNHGLAANSVAWDIIKKGGQVLDAIEEGLRVTENDPNVQTVGLGGFPDREGKVTLDACIMDEHGRCGSVAFLQDIKNPISVARKVMEDTPHVMLVGDGAKQFALEKGFKEENLLTESSKKAWEKWLEESKYKTIVNIENHDTIGMVAMDKHGNLSGGCTTSGMAFKMHGRVGDSPIIGAGLFVDNEIGAATATGVGEAVIRVVGCHLVVELMRQGLDPTEACRQAVERAIKKHPDIKDLQIGFIALRKDGKHGAYSVYNNFNYAVTSDGQHEMVDSSYKYEYS
ncbi:MAG: N(4)-(beta-N-acetylglucosaminyl)-L-asparaginase [Confluentibacter sp.]|nr:N(4)-(beta-N-acetylglucosaminyl)-L-asparaginase [Confluentibacter sp.]HMR16253.1 N(4)-(beta-N-acetylglucosaminyl)-L-asparaginase [Mariniflexile sp.]